MRMPLTIVPITVSPLMMSSRNTMYMWMMANRIRYHIVKWCTVRTVCGVPSSVVTQPKAFIQPLPQP